MYDLNSMPLPELKRLSKDVNKAIETYEDRERKAVISELDAIAREKGYSLAQLLEEAPVKIRKTVKAKYANPDDPLQTWTGRGRKPRWATKALEDGKSLEDLAI